MTVQYIAGIVLVVIGLILLALAQRASQAPVDQLSDMMTGSYSDKTVFYFIAGISALIGGILSLVLKRRSLN